MRFACFRSLPSPGGGVLSSPLPCLVASIVLAACAGTPGGATPAPGPVATDDSGPGVPGPIEGEACRLAPSSNLAGVSIRFTASPLKCTFTLAEVAAGIDIPYEVVVDHDIEGTQTLPHDAGGCDGPDASGLAPFETVGGGAQVFGLFDVGLCAAPVAKSVAIKAGTYPHTFHWDGRNWNGPSDTSTPEGAPFPTGQYLLMVDAKGLQPASARPDGGALPDSGATAPYEVLAGLTIVLR